MKIQPLPAAYDAGLMEAALDAAFAEVCRYQFKPERVLPAPKQVSADEYLSAMKGGPPRSRMLKIVQAAKDGMTMAEAAAYAGCSYVYVGKVKRDLKLIFKDGRS